MGEEFSTKSVWNMDEARLKSLQEYLTLAEQAILSWDNEEIYSNLQMIHLILYGGFSEGENTNVDKDFKEIEELKRKPALQNSSDPGFKLAGITLYNKLKDLYKKLSKLQVKHGLYFRKKGDPRKSINM